MEKKFISFILVFVFMISMFTHFGEVTTFAAGTRFAFSWEESKKISDIIDISGRNTTDNELVLKWSYGKIIGGNDDYRDDYLLQYNLTDKERIEIKVKNASDTNAEFEYRVKTLNGTTATDKKANLNAYDENGKKIYFIYDETKNQWYAENNTNDLWQNGNTGGATIDNSIFAPAGVKVEMKNDAQNGIGPNISLEKGKSVAFKYDGKLITLNWENNGENILLGIDNIERSKIYNFNISCKKNNLEYSDYINIFKLAEFETLPIGDEIIDKVINPTSKAGEDPTIEIRVAQPYIWDNNVSQFVYNKPYSDIGYEGLKATIDLETSVSGGNKESIQINIPNIYNTSQKPNISETSTTNGVIDDDYGVQLKDFSGKRYYTFRLKNLESSKLYTIANITMQAIKTSSSATNKLQTKVCSLAVGENAYTYLEYDSETEGTGERILKIKPYNVSGTYYIYKASANLPNMKNDANRISRIDYKVTIGTDFLKVPIPNDLNYYYMVEFVHELGTLDSQKLLDNPDRAAYLITPKLEVKDYKIVTDTTTSQKKLKLVLSWGGGIKTVFNSLVENGKKVTYSFAKTPFSPREGKYTDFFAIDITKGAGSYNFTKNTSENAWETAQILEEGLGYKTGAADKISIAQDGKTEVIETIFTTVLEFDIFNEDNLDLRDEPSSIFYYPSVYYIKMKGSYKNLEDETKETAYCNPVNVTLDANTNVVLPPPQNIAVNTVTSKSFNINWATITDKLYGEYIEANNYKMKNENSAGVDMYITQKNIMTETDADKQLEFFNDANVVSVDFSSIVDKSIKDVVTIDISSKIDAIRDNKMIRITNLPQTLGLNVQIVNIKGLDRNTVYYTALRTVLNVINNADNTEERVVSDAVSQILNVTTKKDDDLLPPKPEEIPPASPTDFREDTEAEQAPTRANLTWTDVKEPQSIDGVEVKKEYELIRLDKKMDVALYSKRNSFDDFWKNDLSGLDSSAKVGLQTSSTMPTGENLLIYNNTDFVLDKPKTNGKYTYKYDKVPKLDFVDDSLMPNKIYYYYIRTVRMAKDSTGVYKEAAWSSWEPVAITTSPVKTPLDLKLERDNTYFNYDKKTEAVISFFAAIPKGTSISDMAILYPLEYSIMMDGGEWQTFTMDVTNSSLFTTGKAERAGYQQFVYKIRGLKAGKGYTIKVRMKSRINAVTESPGIYDSSLYSNTVSLRTDIDEEEYDDEEKIKKWLKLFDDEVLALATKKYWVITDNSNNYEAIYRTKTFDGELQKATSGVYEFEANNQSRQTYYIPANAILNSNNADIGFRAVKGNMSVLVRPNSFDSNTTEAVGNILSKIRDGDLKDYYIKMDMDWVKSRETINNSSPLTEEVQIRFSVVGSKKMERTLDAGFVDLFTKAISGTSHETAIRDKLKKDLKAEVEDNATNEVLYKLVMDAVADVYDDLIEEIEDDFDDNTKYNYTVNSLSEKMLITATINGQSNMSGYRKNNTTWEVQNTRDYGNKKGFETAILGIFTFAGKVINIPDINGVPGINSIKDLIAKYGLDDYLGKDIIDTNVNVTKYMVVGSVARIAGAENTQDEVVYLNNKGVNVTKGKLYNDISNQEALYLIMSLYEMKTNKSLSTIKITNYSAMPNMSSVNDIYKKSLQTAIQLGIWTDTSIQPNDNIKIRTFLEYLTNLNKKVKL